MAYMGVYIVYTLDKKTGLHYLFWNRNTHNFVHEKRHACLPSANGTVFIHMDDFLFFSYIQYPSQSRDMSNVRRFLFTKRN